MIRWRRFGITFLGAAAMATLIACPDDPAPTVPGTDIVADILDVASIDADATTGDIEVEGDLGPEPHRMTVAPRAAASDLFLSDEPIQFRTTATLPSLDVRALAQTADGTIWGGTNEGLVRYNGAKETFESFGTVDIGDGAVHDLNVGENRGLQIVMNSTLAELSADEKTTLKTSFDPGAYQAVAELDGDAILVGSAGLAIIDITTLAVVDTGSDRFTAVVVVDSVAWMIGGAGLSRYSEAAGYEVVAVPEAEGAGLLSLAAGADGVWIGTETGVLFKGAASAKQTIPAHGPRNLPAGSVNAVFEAADGRLLVTHGVAASALTWADAGVDTPFKTVDHYAGDRWLPGTRESREVTDILDDGDGHQWIATNQGITRIDWVARSFAATAAGMEARLDAHFIRMDGFVASDLRLDDAWDPTEWRLYDKDNDGLWTQMQIGAWCYAYAVTGDDSYRAKARKSMDAMLLLAEVPKATFEAAGMDPGFITRSLVRSDEGALYTEKATRDNWHLQSYEGVDYYWKDDTSSDEYAGHFYGFPLYYDLCATSDAERKVLADTVALATDYIIDNGYLLIDLDGEPTLHGHWDPDQMSFAWRHGGIDACLGEAFESEDPNGFIQLCGESWYGGGWLNSIEILGQLLATAHMTGDARYRDAYEELYTKWLYRESASPHEDTFTITAPNIMNHSDHELAMLAYATLVRYETDVDRRDHWIEGMRFLYDEEASERNPLWTALVALAAGEEAIAAQADSALEAFRKFPRDQREFALDNSHRLDSAGWPDDRADKPQFKRVFPYDEIRSVWWNGNLHAKFHGGHGTEVNGPMAWLLPYWGMRYAGLIEAGQ